MNAWRRSVAPIVAALIAAGATTGCTVAPTGLEAAVETMERDLESSPAISEVVVSFGEVDSKDRAGEWSAQVRATAGPGQLLGAAAAMEDATRGWTQTAALSAVLEATDGAADVTLLVFTPADVNAATLLASVPGTTALTIDRIGSTLTAPGTSLSDTAAILRANAFFGAPGSLGTVTATESDATIEIGRDGPSPELLDAVDELVATGATGLSLTEHSGEPDHALRPRLQAQVADPEAVAARLRVTPDAGNTVAGRALTAFALLEPGTETGAVPAPFVDRDDDDGPAQEGPRSVTGSVGAELPLDKGVVLTDAAARALLDAAAATSGAPTTITVTLVDCDAPGLRRYDGHAFLDVFTVTDHAQDPYDDIVATWEAEGMREADVAMGHVTYATGDSVGTGIDTATIWGTVDGLHIDVSTPCS